MRKRMWMALVLSLMLPRVAAAVRDSVALGEAVVTGTRLPSDVRHLPFTVTTVDSVTLTQEHRASVLPLLSSLTPSLFVTQRGLLGYGVAGGAAGGINLRGLSGGSGALLVLIDGLPQYNGVYGHPISDSYQTLMAERVEVLRGPASMLYGSNAMGGVVNIVTRTPHTDGRHTTLGVGAGSYGTVETEAAHQVRRGKFAATLAARYGRSDNHRPRMGFEQYGGRLKADYAFNRHWKTSVQADVTHFNAANPGTTAAPLYGADQWITRGVLTAVVENHFPNTSGALSVYNNFGRHKIDDGTTDPSQPTQRYFRSRDALTGISWFQHATLFAGNRLTVGADYRHLYGYAYYTSKATGETLDTPNKQSGRSHRNEIAVYVALRQDLAPWLTLDAGVRLDHHSVSGSQWVPQGGLVVRPLPTAEAKAMVSKGFRNPTMRELYLYPPSNTDLQPERLVNYELAWKHRLAENAFVYGINLFWLRGDNMIETTVVDGRPRNVNTGEVENRGLEVEASWRLGAQWTLQTNHSFLHMEHPVLAAPEYKGYIGADYRHRRWVATLGLQYVAGLYTATGDSPRQEDFWRLDGSLNYRLRRGLTLWARGENLLAQRYEVIAGFPMPKATFMGGVQLTF